MTTMASCNGVAHAVSLLRTYTQAVLSFTADTLEFLQQSALFTLMHALHADHGAGFGPQPLMPRHVKRAEGYIR